MPANSPQDQNKKEFKEYLDKTGVLEFLNTNVPKNQKNKEFKKFLDKAGVPEFLDSVLVKLYEKPDKPSDVLEYIKNSIGGAKADKEEIAKLSYENHELKKKIEELEKTETQLKEKLMGAADAPANNAVNTAANAAQVSATALHEPLVGVPNININSFSDELLETLLSLLPPRDLMSAVLVCKRWNRIGEGSNLWSWVNFEANLADMPKILGLSRLAQLEKLTLDCIFKKTLEAIENHKGLKTLKLLQCNVSRINSDLLARVLTKMEKVHMEKTDLTKNQWNAFFDSMSDDSKLKKLEIIGLSLTKANPQSLAEAVSKLEMFELEDGYYPNGHDRYGFQLTSEHSKAMFKQLAIKSKLKSLKISCVPLTWVEEPSLVTVLGKLEEAALCATSLNARQCTAIIGLVAAGKSKLKVLHLTGNNLKHVNPPDMAKAVGNMEIIGLRGTSLTNEQCKEIFMYAQGDSYLKVLIIGGNDLHSVGPGSLAKTVSKMEKCYLMRSKLTRPQLEAIFKQLNEDCNLKELDVSKVSLSEVEGDVISKAIANLVEVNLGFTHLTTQQLEALFMEIKSGRKLKILKLLGTNLRSVKIDSLVGALSCVDVVHLSRNSLTPEQWDAVKSIPEDCRPRVMEN